MTPKNERLITGLSLAAALAGCASVAPTQLVEARSEYASASQGLAARRSPAELYDAQKALEQANQEFAKHGDTLAVRDQAYIAFRKVELANSKARTEEDRRQIAGAEKAGVVVRDNQVKSAQGALARTREQLKDERVASDAAAAQLQATNAAQGKELAVSAERLEAEKQARTAAEARLDGAMKDLASVAAVKVEARGVVITLAGSALFASSQYALLEGAKASLDKVAEALKAQADDRTMVVEGHTDSTGGEAANLTLSLNRASAVRDSLIARGVPGQRITATGLGESRPLLDNLSPGNRAGNRRVEIVIHSGEMSAR